MKAKLINQYIKGINDFPDKKERHWDTEIKGFFLQVSPAGRKTFYYRYSMSGKKKDFKIGTFPDIAAAQARDLAKTRAGEVAKDVDIQKEKKESRHKTENQKKTTLIGYIQHEYKEHLLIEKKSGAKMLKDIESHFKQWNGKQLTDINSPLVRNWRNAQLKKGLTTGAVNRPIAYLRALLNHAYRHSRIIDHHPLDTFKQLKEDKKKIVRYLDEKEELKLRQAIIDRDNQAQQKRKNYNQWRKNRGYELLPEIPKGGFGDYLSPMVILTLNTGMRRGELFNLQWQDIDFKAKTLAIHGITSIQNESSKSGTTRILPLNNEALDILIKWKNQSGTNNLVFTGKSGKLTDIKKSFTTLLKNSNINNFRFHDLRHHFASKLAMAGVDLNTIRELLGHSDLQMTMRYAHLAPSNKSKAVELLNN